MLPRPHRPRVVAVCLRRVSDGASGSGEVAPLPHRRPGRAQQTGAGRARPSRFAVAFGEPGPPDAAPLPLGWTTAYGRIARPATAILGAGAKALNRTPLALGLLAAQ